MGYYEDKRLNASLLKCFAGEHYSQRQAAHRHQHFTPTKAVELGSAVHYGVENIGIDVELETYADFFQSLKTPKARLGNAEEVPHIIKAFREQKPELCEALVDNKGNVEQEIYGEKYKCKPDFFLGSRVWDWKTTSDVSFWGIKNTINRLNYLVQAYVYLEATGLSEFTFTFIQTSAPYEVVDVHVSKKMLEIGKGLALQAEDRYLEWKRGETQEAKVYTYNEWRDETEHEAGF